MAGFLVEAKHKPNRPKSFEGAGGQTLVEPPEPFLLDDARDAVQHAVVTPHLAKGLPRLLKTLNLKTFLEKV